MTRLTSRRGALGALLLSTTLATTAYADGRDYKDGPVINVASVRTVDGHFDDYMHWLTTTWKRQEEAAKKAGLINNYEVLVVEPRGPQDPDIYLVVEYKNWAALDGLGGKLDSISTQIEGSVDKANESEASRAKIRTLIGSQTMQRADLK
jgi:hypothetical protein